MVATRHSVPNDDDTDPLSSINRHDLSVPRELRGLHIDGKQTLRGGARKEERAKVYHWRGAVYAVTDDTPQEWIDQERERFKKTEYEPRRGTRKRGRPDEQQEAQPSKKRQSTGMIRDEQVEEHEGVRTRRMRQSLPAMFPKLRDTPQRKKGSALRTGRNTSHVKAKQQFAEKYDYSGSYSQDSRPSTWQAKEIAREKGYAVEALPEKKLEGRLSRPGNEPIWLARFFENIYRMAKINRSIIKLISKDDNMKTWNGIMRLLQQRRLRRKQAMSGSVVELQDTRATTEGQVIGGAEEEEEEEDRMDVDGDAAAKSDVEEHDVSQALMGQFMEQLEEAAREASDAAKEQQSQEEDEDEKRLRDEEQLRAQLVPTSSPDPIQPEPATTAQITPPATCDEDEEEDEEAASPSPSRYDSAASVSIITSPPPGQRQMQDPLNRSHDAKRQHARNFRYANLQTHWNADQASEQPSRVGSMSHPPPYKQTQLPKPDVKSPVTRLPAAKQPDIPQTTRDGTPASSSSSTNVSHPAHLPAPLPKSASDPTTTIPPATSRGGHSLRWSLDPDRFPTSTGAASSSASSSSASSSASSVKPLAVPTLKLSEKLDDVERAENAIHRGRLEGESKAARRRRVKREFDFLRSLPLVEGDGEDDEFGGVGEDGVVGGAEVV